MQQIPTGDVAQRFPFPRCRNPAIPDAVAARIFGMTISNDAVTGHMSIAVIIHSIAAVTACRARGIQGAVRRLEALEPDSRPELADVEAARRTAVRIRTILRCLAGRQRCLYEATGICAGLRRTGFDAVLTFGHALNEGFDFSRGDVHAWVTLRSDPRPLDTLSTYDYQYFVIGRYPGSCQGRRQDITEFR